LTRNEWQIFPRVAHETRADGTVCHGSTDNPESFRQAFVDSFADTPEKVLVGTPRGGSIKCQLDQGRLLQYFAWAGQAIDVGVAFSVDNFQIEYWFNLALQPQPDDEDLNVYVLALQALWFERLQELVPQIAKQAILLRVTDCRFEMRYVGNGLKVWFAPAGFVDWKPLLDSPLPRDKWVTNEAFALSFPPCADDHSQMSASILFDGILQERYGDPEVHGGKIASMQVSR
jgi:hypothetical protein